MTTIASLRVNLEAQTARFRRGISSARESLVRFAARAKIAAAASAAALGAMFAKVTNDADQLNNLALRLGTTTEALSELRHVAAVSGVDFNVFSTAMQRMVRRIDEAAKTGKGEAAPALKELGLDAERLAALPLDKQFEVIASQMALMTRQASRVRLAMKLFDTEGVALVQTMSKGGAGIRAMRKDARDLGIVLDKETAKGAAEVAASFVVLKNTLFAFAQNFLLQFAPQVQSAIENFTTFFTDNFGRIRDWLNNFVGESAALFGLLGIAINAFLKGDYKRGVDVLINVFDVLLKKIQTFASAGADAFKEVLGGDTLRAFSFFVDIITKGFEVAKRQIEAVGLLIAGIAASIGALSEGNFSGAFVAIKSSVQDAVRQAASGITGEAPAAAGVGDEIQRLEQTNISQLDVLRSIDGKLTNVGVAQ
jgi:hypothetical protein